MKKIRAAIVGYGNIGVAALEALLEAPDFEVAGVVRRDPSQRENIPAEIPVVASIADLEGVDVAILASPTRLIEKQAKEILAAGINTVDS
ncbi:MAG: Gfo/Idh/MocA family oxidoreductase, partial [Muribaculaceae bacterium]|nr:Gfo/Idh/MocA family oxidoreductase [Muribaculaceae bacterium]